MFETTLRRIACAASLALLLPLGVSATEPAAEAPSTPFLELREGDDVHHSGLKSIEGFQQPLVTVANPSEEEALAFQVLAMGEVTRSIVAELEPGGRMIFTLGAGKNFETLAVISRGPFQAEVGELRGERKITLEGVRTAEEDAAKSILPQSCGGVWTLSCISPLSCTYQSPAISGRVFGNPGPFSHHNVYWNLHTPNGSWQTKANGCATFWSPDANKPGCPATAYNCHGQLYTISGAISLE